MCEFSNEGLIRSFEEFDEKLPIVAKIIVKRGIDFSRLNAGIESEEGSVEFEADCEVLQSIYTIFREMVECTSEMTADELEYYIDALLTACELVVMISDGLAYENKENGKFFLTPEGHAIYEQATSDTED